MRLVVDTNVLVSAFLWQGTPGRLARQVSRDADDDAVLACALASRADLIVSGDADLLVLKQFQGIRIVTAAQAVTSITTS